MPFKNLLILFFTLLCLYSNGQLGYNEQYVVRDRNGHELVNDSAKIECVWADSLNNTIAIETYHVRTNQFGLCNVHVSDATAKIIKPYWDKCDNDCDGKQDCYCNGIILNTRFYTTRGELLSTYCQGLSNTRVNCYGLFMHLTPCQQ